MADPKVYHMTFASIYPLYVNKVERKDRTQAELDEVLRWLTGYTQEQLLAQIAVAVDLEQFFAEAPRLNPNRTLIKGVVCGVRVENIEEPLMQEIRYMDKLVDELAKGKALAKILRS
ncbi:DUF2200 domain-containing protein [Enterococcus diestrammenae]|uniref:DUF2200 domain-containing protein n=1 Tax=Enterococcus diestrammenae TaxID=1155073 RepID=A0ABV0F4I4_9ENTE|nr:DUF2200 domain-containing protein [Enterococcus diestrammenae]KAF1295438.1 hypothetical protein BAU18_02290 [Enterococcus diestrammenae]